MSAPATSSFDKPTPLPLHLHTVESLCSDLISGKQVGISEGNTSYSLGSTTSRSILYWYFQNRAKWTGNVMERDIEAIVRASSANPPQLSTMGMMVPTQKRCYRLAKIEAHQFAGLHAPQSTETFIFAPTKSISLFEGWNGSGKTSLLNAIVWCLTGQILRPQRKPETANVEFECQIARGDSDSPHVSVHKLTPVGPMPDARRYLPEVTQEKLPLDTWVELTFEDDDGNVLPPVRRTQGRNPRAALLETQPDLSVLRLDPIAAHMGTTMPGLIPFVQVGAVSEFGRAAAELTGLAELVDLARHIDKARQRLQVELPKARDKEMKSDDGEFRQAREDLQELLSDHSDLATGKLIPEPSGDTDIEGCLSSLVSHFEGCKARILQAAQSVLGTDFDPADRVKREDLEQNVGPALVQLQQLNQLPSATRLSALSGLTDLQLDAARSLVDEARAQAATLDELASTPSVARRKQLYARVSSWMKEYETEDLRSCVVCGAGLETAVDPVTGELVRDHLREALADNAELIAHTSRSWAEVWSGRLAKELPPALRAELDKELPDAPTSLIRQTVCEELFETLPFKKTLGLLKVGVRRVCDASLATLSPFVEPDSLPLPSKIGKTICDLWTVLQRADRACAFAKWRRTNTEHIKELFRVVLAGGSIDAVNDDAPLKAKLMALDATVRNAIPAAKAREFVERMNRALQKRREKEKLIQRYAEVATAMEELVGLGELAERQVESLHGILQERAIFWRDRIYHNAYAHAGHALIDTAMDSKGTLSILVGSGSAFAPAQHVANSSSLRASLFGFFLAFWEHVLKTRGGLRLLLLDDPQELLDDDNRERLARAMLDLVDTGGQLFVTTHDRLFARLTSQVAGRTLIEHRSVHPVNLARRVAETALAIELLDQKRSDFERRVDVSEAAQEYASEARVFIEARLADLFDDPAYPAYSAPSKAPTLSDHVNRLRGLVHNPPNELFRSPVVASFCNDPALANGARCLSVLNTAHHNKASLTYNAVHLVREELMRLRGLAEDMHGEFRRWRWREPVAARVASVVSLEPAQHPPFEVAIYPDLVAFTMQLPPGGSQDREGGSFNSTWLADKALFYLKNENLGFSAPSGTLAIVECDPKPGNDRNLVIALRNGRTYARRLLRVRSAGSILALAAETPDPRKSPPTILVEPDDVQIHRIVGVLFENTMPPREKEEAVQIGHASVLVETVTAHRVRDDSALPLALPGQLVLGGPFIQPTEFDAHEGKLVAVMLSNGVGLFKRIGPRLSGRLSALRQFESIGGLGSSYLAATEQLEGDLSTVPVVVQARQILGVLYDA